MKLFRKVIFWCHLVAGVAAGLVILLMCVTGVLLTYERQLTHWADTRGYQVEPPSPHAQRLGVESLLAGVRGRAARGDRRHAARRLFGPRGGRLRPRRRPSSSTPTRAKCWARARPGSEPFSARSRTGTAGSGRPAKARAAASGAPSRGPRNLVFLFIVVSGFYLWWPRKWTKSLVRNVTWFRRGLADRARNFNWHNVIGFWSAVPLFIIVLSGVVISYPWAGNLVYRVFGEAPPAQRAANAAPQQRRRGRKARGRSARRKRDGRHRPTVGARGAAATRLAEHQPAAARRGRGDRHFHH